MEKLEQSAEEDKTRLQTEVDELKETLPDLLETLKDAEDSVVDNEKKEAIIKECKPKKVGFEDSTTVANTPAADITNLVRKGTKRVAEPIADEPKKSKHEATESENIDAPAAINE